MNKPDGSVRACLPKPIQVVIDDVGWWSGEDGHERQEPYRTGIPRNHVPADYEAIARLGRELGIRPQAAMVLCEWDKDNILRDLPTSTWMGPTWDNRKWIGPWLEEAAGIIRSNNEHIEPTLHGIGHEYWIVGILDRAEWHDRHGRMRPRDQVEAHLDFYARLMSQHDLGPFPESFVPAAFLHHFGPAPGNRESLAEILARRGIRSISTPFHRMHNRDAAEHGLFGIDAGIMTIDRGSDIMPWNALGVVVPRPVDGCICGMHWPNMLHNDPQRNHEVVDVWVRLLRPYDNAFDTMLAPDTATFRRQLVHHVRAGIEVRDDGLISLDFRDTGRSTGGSPMTSPAIVHIETDAAATFEARGAAVQSLTRLANNADNARPDPTTIHRLKVTPQTSTGRAEIRVRRQESPFRHSCEGRNPPHKPGTGE